MPPTIKNTWKQRDAEGTIRRLTTPTGSECDAERVGLAGLVKTGTLNEGDTLTNLVDSKHIRRVRGGKGPDHEEINIQSLMSDPAALGRVVMLVDRVMPHIVKDPVVLLHFEDMPDGTTVRIPEDKRNPDAVYTDQIPLEDKMYLFNWGVGGTGDSDRFLDETRGAVAGVEDGAGVRPAAKRPARGRR